MENVKATVHQDAPDRLKVTGTLNFDTVLALREAGERFLRDASTEQPIVFDFSQVNCVDTAVLPLITAWLRAAKRHGVVVQFRPIPESLAQIAKVCGLLPWIN